MSRRRRSSVGLVALVLLAIVLTSLGQVADGGPETTSGSALDQLRQLEEAPEAGGESYARDLFGDYDRPLVLSINYGGYPACEGYYSEADAVCHLDAAAVEVDHLVALAEAWESGASEWGSDRLDEFAGDVDNLWVMTGPLNRAKSDLDPAVWMPPDDDAWCGYAARWVEVKAEWGLSVDRGEAGALRGVLAGCPDGGS